MQFNINKLDNYQYINTIDAHTEGEPLRIITQGFPTIKGNTILEKRQYLIKNLDHYRQLLMFEPRGHADMYGALITEPCTKDAQFGILFMHNEGYSSMCGHGIIATISVAIETGALSMPSANKAIGIDSPAGLISAYAKYDDDKNIIVSFDNVPAFIEVLDQSVIVQGLGKVDYDIAYGGAYYAFVDADKLGIECSPTNNQTLIKAGWDIKKAIMENYVLQHPVEQDLSFLYGTIFYSKKTTLPHSHSRHVCVFANGEVDRSPTGTGVSARAAILAKKEELALHEDIVIESIVDGKMTVNIQQFCEYYGKKAIIPRVSGRAFITGYHKFLLNHKDIFPHGFILR